MDASKHLLNYIHQLENSRHVVAYKYMPPNHAKVEVYYGDDLETLYITSKDNGLILISNEKN